MRRDQIVVGLVLVLFMAVLEQISVSARVNAGSPDRASCLSQCATVRDNCRLNACTGHGGQTHTPQACDNLAENQKKPYLDAVTACFDQEKKCDAGCPTQ
jgi:hypothetical protein